MKSNNYFLLSSKTLLLFLVCFCTQLIANNPPKFDWKADLKLCSGKTFDPKSYAAERGIAIVQAVQNGGLWYQTSTWDTGMLPSVNDIVIIPSGMTVYMAGTMRAKNITVYGELKGVNWQPVGAWIELQTEYILVDGTNALFEIGTAAQRYHATADCKITLTGLNDGDDIANMGDKFIGAVNGATISMHGLDKISWTQLSANAAAGATQIQVKEAVDWNIGDEIVIVSSRLDYNEAEKRTIIGISSDQQTLTLDAALVYPHTGITQSVTNSGHTWTADLRAEVGVLTHNILIQGDAQSDIDGFGGHIMLHSDAKAYISNIELYRMGQKSILGRYPFHWHMLGSAGNGQYFTNSSVHQSYNRAVTIHGTEFTLVENNFLYDHIGHGVFLEDGSERFNVIRGNVALLTKRPAPGEELTPSDNELDQVQNRTPSTYWITNPRNTFENNVAAGTEGTGFWFALPQKPMGASATDPRFSSLEPYKEDLILFKGNVAHSCANGFDAFDQLSASHSIMANGAWQNTNDHLIEDCLWYSNQLGIYTGIGGGYDLAQHLIFLDNIFVENRVSTMLASYSKIEQSMFVANSGQNLISGERYAYRVYDGAGLVNNSYFLGWDASNANLLLNTGAAIKHPNHYFSNSTTNHSGTMRAALPNYDVPPSLGTGANAPQHPRMWSVVLRDITGEISGKANTSIVSNHPFLLIGDEYQAANWTNVYRTDRHYALARPTYDLGFAQYPNVTITRQKPNLCDESVYYIDGYKEWHQLPFIVNDGFEYTYQYESLPITKVVRLNIEDTEVGAEMIMRFKDFGKLGGLSILSAQMTMTPKTSLIELRNATTSSYYQEPSGDLYIKSVAVSRAQRIDIYWTTDFSVPLLDTDGDGVSDYDEIAASTDPFEETKHIVQAKLLLQGASNSASSMHTSLQSILPLRDPYTAASFVQTIPADVVDWILLEIRDASDPSVIIAKRTGFLRNDGQVVDLDGSIGLLFKNLPSIAYVAVRHRNHLGVMTATSFSL